MLNQENLWSINKIFFILKSSVHGYFYYRCKDWIMFFLVMAVVSREIKDPIDSGVTHG